MIYPISSRTFANPLQVEVLQNISAAFCRMEKEFIVIGAASRDILCLYLETTPAPRKTRDLDIAIAIDSWDDYDTISHFLQDTGFRKDPHRKQRFYFGTHPAEYEIDIVPFGGVSNTDEKIYWPPEESPMMSVKGFASVLKDCVDVVVDDAFSFKIPSAPAFFVLKFDAWLDRHLKNDKDAQDMSFVLSNYYIHEITEGHHIDVVDILDGRFDPYVAGAYMIATDIADLLSAQEIKSYAEDIENELKKAEQSKLLTQCMTPTCGYDIVFKAWRMIADVFNKKIGHEGS